jgi:multicomponent Na+:H+ antiporter subunit B
MTTLFGVFLLTLLVITAVAVVRARHLVVAVMLLGIFSLLLAVNFFLLDAADVALTEAAVGAGISTVLFLAALALTSEREHHRSRRPVVSLLVVVAAVLVVVYATFDQPLLGDPEAPVLNHVGPWYLGDPEAPVLNHVGPWYMEETPELIDIPNVVTAVLGSYRGYDTLGEVFVVFTAGIGVLFLLSAGPGVRDSQRRAVAEKKVGMRDELVPHVVGQLLIPFILLFGLYVQFHGEYGPGGGFQAGALIAAAFILYGLIEGEQRALEALPHRGLTFLMVGGALLYGTVGIAGMLLGSNFLAYSVLDQDPVFGQKMGIILIEAGVGMTVSGVLLKIYHAFACRERIR